jgi:hypothetical protein
MATTASLVELTEVPAPPIAAAWYRLRAPLPAFDDATHLLQSIYSRTRFRWPVVYVRQVVNPGREVWFVGTTAPGRPVDRWRRRCRLRHLPIIGTRNIHEWIGHNDMLIASWCVLDGATVRYLAVHDPEDIVERVCEACGPVRVVALNGNDWASLRVHPAWARAVRPDTSQTMRLRAASWRAWEASGRAAAGRAAAGSGFVYRVLFGDLEGRRPRWWIWPPAPLWKRCLARALTIAWLALLVAGALYAARAWAAVRRMP